MTVLIGNWWSFVLRGILAVLFGIITFFRPHITLIGLVYAFGFYALAEGVINLIAAFRRSSPDQQPWWALLLEGVFSIIAGLLAFFWPGITAMALLFMIATSVVSIGTGTPWKGLSSDRQARTFGQGTLLANVSAFLNVSNSGTLVLGNGTNPLSNNLSVVGTNSVAPSARATLTARGAVVVDTDQDSFSNVQLQVSAGATVTFVRGMGVGTNTLDTTVLRRGLVDFGNNAGAFSGNLSLAQAGVMWLHNPGDLNAGPNASLNLAAGSIVRISDADALSNSSLGPGTGPGTLAGNLSNGSKFIVQLETDQIGYLSGTALARVSPGAVFVVAGGNRVQDAGLTLNGGMLTNDTLARTFSSAGGVSVGGGGATFAATTGNQFTINADVNAGTNGVTVGFLGNIGTNGAGIVESASSTGTLAPVTLTSSLKAGTVAFGGSVSGGFLTVATGLARFSNTVNVGALAVVSPNATSGVNISFTGPVTVGGTSLVRAATLFDNDLTLGVPGNTGVVFTNNGTGAGVITRFGNSDGKVTINGDVLLDTTLTAAHTFNGSAAVGGSGWTIVTGDLTVRNGSATFLNGTSRVGGNIILRGPGSVSYANAASNYAGGLTFNGGSIGTIGAASLVLGGNVSGSGGSSGAAAIAGTLNFGGSTRTFSINAGTGTLDLNVTASITGGATGVGLVKDGTGVLQLSGANNLTGGISINAGTLIANNNLAFNGTAGGAINLASGARLEISTGATGIDLSRLAVASNGTIRLSADIGNATAWVTPILGTLELNSANIATNSGSLGTLNLGDNAVVKAMRNVIFGNTGVASFDLGGQVTFDTRLGTLTVNGDLTGAGGFSVTGTNALTLRGNNVFTGSTTISTFVSIGSTTAINTTAPILVVSGGTLDIGPGAASIDLTNLRPLTAGAALRFSTDVGATNGGAIISPGVVTGGRLEINADVATDPAATLAFNLADGSVLKGISNATFGNAGHTVLNLASGAQGITFNTGAGSMLNLNGPIAGAANVAVTGGTGTLSLNAANPGYSGIVTVSGGAALRVGNVAAIDLTKMTLGVGGHFDVGPGAGGINLTPLPQVTAGRFLRLSTDLAAGGAVVPANLIAGGTLEINADNATNPAATLNFNLADASAVKWLANTTFGNAAHDVLNLATGTSGTTFDAAAGATLTIAGRITGGGIVTVGGGTGTLSLAAANTGFSGTVTVGSGATLRLGNVLSLNGGKVTVGSGSRLEIGAGAEGIHLDALTPIGAGAALRLSTDVSGSNTAGTALFPTTLLTGGTLEVNSNVGVQPGATNLAAIGVQQGSVIKSVFAGTGAAAVALGNTGVASALFNVSGAGTSGISFNTPAGSDLILRGQLNGGTTLTKTGTGTLFVSRGELGVSKFDVQQGTLTLGELAAGNGAYVSPSGNGTFVPVTIAAGATLDVGNSATILGLAGAGRVGSFFGTGESTLTVDVVGSNLFGGAVTQGPGRVLSLVKQGPGSLQLSPGTNNNFTGSVLVLEGTLIGTGSAGGGLAFGTFGGGTNPVTVGGAGSASASVLLLSSAALTKNIIAASGGSGVVTIGGAPGAANAGAFSGSITLNRSIVATGRATFSGSISGTGGINVATTGIVTFSGSNNTYSGGTLLSSGTMSLGRDNVLGVGPLTLGTATIQADTARTFVNAVTLAGNPTFGTSNGAGSGSLTFTGPVTLTSDTTLTVRNTTSFTGVFSGNFAVTKAGSGTLVMTNYGGPLNVTAGKLVLNGTIAGTGVVNVGGGAVIGGSGTIAGSLSVGDGGTLAPGNSPGVVTVAGKTLTLAGGANYSVDVNGKTAGVVPVGYDQTNHTATSGAAVDLGGTGTSGAVLSLNVGSDYLGTGAIGDDFFIINDALGPVTGNFAFDTGSGLQALTDGATFTDPATGAAFTIHYNDAAEGLNPLGTTYGVVLTTQAIPEPTASLLLLTATGGILALRRRKRKARFDLSR